MINQTEIIDSNVGLEFSANHSTYNNLEIRQKMIRNENYYVVTNLTLNGSGSRISIIACFHSSP